MSAANDEHRMADSITMSAGQLIFGMATGFALLFAPSTHAGTAAALDFTIEPADVGLGEPVYLDFIASNPSMQIAEFDLNMRLLNDLELSYRVPDSDTFEPLRLIPETGSTVAFVGNVPPYGEVKRRFLLNTHVPITVTGTYEIVGRFKADPESGRAASQIDRVFAVGPHSESRTNLMVREFAEKFHASHTAADKMDAVEALSYLDSPSAIPEMIRILSDSPVLETTIFDSLANRHGDAGIEALLRVLSTSSGAERRLLVRGALLRRQGAITDADLARRVLTATMNP